MVGDPELFLVPETFLTSVVDPEGDDWDERHAIALVRIKYPVIITND
jgi:hypothetical protein